jgi:spermidine synthase
MEALGLAAAPKTRKVLVIGLGAGIIPTWFERRGFEVEVVEINPQMLDIARDCFGLKAPPVVIHLEDGRRFLRRSPAASYDLVFLDVFSGEEIPYHLLTEEAFAEVRKVLRPNGAFVINYVAYREKPKTRVTATLAKALQASFGQVDVFATGLPEKLNNLILVAAAERRAYAPVPPVEISPTEIMTLDEILKDRIELAQPYDLSLNDDHAPMEWLDREVRFAWRREVLAYFGTVIKGI